MLQFESFRLWLEMGRRHEKYDYWYWYELRMTVLKRDRACRYCGIPLTKLTVTLDHVIPVSKGGTNDLDNLVACCKKCNHDKDSMSADEFIATRTQPRQEMAATSVVMGQNGKRPDVGPDAQIEGAPESAGRSWPNGVERPRRKKRAGG